MASMRPHHPINVLDGVFIKLPMHFSRISACTKWYNLLPVSKPYGVRLNQLTERRKNYFHHDKKNLYLAHSLKGPMKPINDDVLKGVCKL